MERAGSVRGRSRRRVVWAQWVGGASGDVSSSTHSSAGFLSDPGDRKGGRVSSDGGGGRGASRLIRGKGERGEGGEGEEKEGSFEGGGEGKGSFDRRKGRGMHD
jgi:hypothetical protein